jgi:PBP1b-binding outer membrane lipoprotein LpoB
MKKKILLSSIMTALMFSGCLSIGDAKPDADKITKAKDKVEANTNKVTKSANNVKKKVETVTKDDSMPTPPESLLKDKVIETVVEISDDKVDTTNTQLIESVD